MLGIEIVDEIGVKLLVWVPDQTKSIIINSTLALVGDGVWQEKV